MNDDKSKEDLARLDERIAKLEPKPADTNARGQSAAANRL